MRERCSGAGVGEEIRNEEEPGHWERFHHRIRRRPETAAILSYSVHHCPISIFKLNVAPVENNTRLEMWKFIYSVDNHQLTVKERGLNL